MVLSGCGAGRRAGARAARGAAGAPPLPAMPRPSFATPRPMLLLLAPARRVMIRAAWVLLAALLAAVAGATALNNSLGLTPQVRSRGGRYTHTCCVVVRG
jgi:hypothetical protein